MQRAGQEWPRQREEARQKPYVNKSLEMIENLKDTCSWRKVAKRKSAKSYLEEEGHINYYKRNGKSLNIFERALISLITLFTYFSTNNIVV